MKNIKKILALVLALTMVLSMSAVVFAAEGDTTPTGSITISNTTAGEEYAVYKVFDLAYATPVAYNADGTASSPVAYTYTASGDEDAFLAALSGTGSPFVLTESTTEGVYNVTLAEGKTASEVSTFLKGIIIPEEGAWDPDQSKESEAGGALTFEGLDYGYYFITSSLGTVVTIDSTLPNVTVIDKNQEPTWDNNPDNPDEPGPGKVIIETEPQCGKDVHEHTEDCYDENDELICTETEHAHTADCYKTTENSATYGETVNFDIGINAPSNAADKYVMNYYISDSIESGFDYVLDNGIPAVTVKVGDVTLTADKYTLVPVITGEGDNAKITGFEIAIPWATETKETVGEGEDAEEVVTAITSKYPGMNQIHVTYSAVVNANAELASDSNDNTANFAYDTNKPGEVPNEPYDPENPPEDDDDKPWDESNEKTTKTYVYALGILKVDEKGTPLAGATFSVNKGTTAIKATATAEAGIYVYSSDATNTSFVTNEDGILIIKGLDEGTYTFTETEAPAGYNKLEETFDVVAQVSEEVTYTSKITTYYDANGNVITKEAFIAAGGVIDPEDENYDEDVIVETTVAANVVPQVVVNKTGTELPSTGGIGTTIFYVLGGILLAGAAVLLITKKRMSAEA